MQEDPLEFVVFTLYGSWRLVEVDIDESRFGWRAACRKGRVNYSTTDRLFLVALEEESVFSCCFQRFFVSVLPILIKMMLVMVRKGKGEFVG